jgi:hypothetical protein
VMIPATVAWRGAALRRLPPCGFRRFHLDTVQIVSHLYLNIVQIAVEEPAG